jgi:peptidoglycan/LPS O-acetylase OafA/YrhL
MGQRTHERPQKDGAASPPVFGEIQGLRAVAVGLVLLFHVWPGLAPGGYVGVDAFFVISGYLITGSLFRMALEHGGISLPEFYNRRIRRLLPAATFVLLLTAIGTFLLLPASRWQEVVAQVVASAFYVENWALPPSRSTTLPPATCPRRCSITGRCQLRSSFTSSGRC